MNTSTGAESAVRDLLRGQRAFFDNGRTLPLPFRIHCLRELQHAVLKRQTDIEDALQTDLRRSHFESFLSETILVLAGIKHAVKNIPHWAAPQKIRPSILNFCSTDMLIPEPYGLSLIISPWNYPFLLTLGPLTAAVGAGNCAVLKPSELAPASSSLLEEIVGAVFNPEHVAVIQGDADTARDLLSRKFDKIFFTGSARVGKEVLKAAAERLIPTTLEMGGKSPCIVAETADLPKAARRIVWGKLFNAGQTCLAPDYLLTHPSRKDELLKLLVKTIKSFYGRDIKNNPDYPRIINEKNFLRLSSYIEPDKVVCGGEQDIRDLYIAPTILDGVAWDDPVMTEEIFGPVLPVLTYASLEEAAQRIKAREKPLALYLFTSDQRDVDFFWSKCSFGGGCVNDTLTHVINERLPFGGVGASGMGRYRGQWGWREFSHLKTLSRRNNYPYIPLRYPPYSAKERFKSFLAHLFRC
ncbi:MAG: aldehyde dehydrogenase [Desulfovibrio sp.]|jgi:aldehyde dehydrogenase (NAD+)|nr:aldehyde dehydrogenase [Desulfovibrio sp.]